MNPLAFFRLPEVLKAMDRASKAAAAPLSLHVVRDGEESPRILGTGRCATCGFLAQHPDGRQACRASRAPHAVKALRRHVPVPFVCHMGFACVSVAALSEDGLPYVITLGPYCPLPRGAGNAAAAVLDALGRDADRGLQALGLDEDASARVDDIAVVPADTVPAVAEWLVDTLDEYWRRWRAEAAPSDDEVEDGDKAMQGRSNRVAPDPFQAMDIAAAVRAGDRKRVRALVRVVLHEGRGDTGSTQAVAARAYGVAGAVLEALAAQGVDISEAWEAMAAWADRDDGAEWPGEIARLFFAVASPAPNGGGGLVERVDRLVAGRLDGAIRLNDIAGLLHVTPSAVTHALQRAYGLSFTQYVGRLRVDRVKDLLRRTRLSMRDVALRIGVRDMSNFNRLFKKYEGMTPAEYRKRYGVRE